MSLGLLKAKFGKDPHEFNTIEELTDFVEKELGHELDAKYVNSDIVSNRGSVIPVSDIDVDGVFEDVDGIFEKALEKTKK